MQACKMGGGRWTWKKFHIYVTRLFHETLQSNAYWALHSRI